MTRCHARHDQKLESDPARPRLLTTEVGVGYRLRDRVDEGPSGRRPGSVGGARALHLEPLPTGVSC